MTMSILHLVPLGCDGCWAGWQAVLGVGIAVVVLIGSIYMLLASNFGARLGYLVLMVSLMAWMILLSTMWLFGLPGTTLGTGPRGAEAQWIPFLSTSPQGQVFASTLNDFPNGSEWKPIGTLFSGNIDSKGEFDTVRGVVKGALAAYAAKQGLPATDPADWGFRAAGIPPATPDEEPLPQAKVAFSKSGTPLLFGVDIPANDKHREVIVFAYRNKGKVYLYALYFLIVSALALIVHLWLLARYERKEKEREAAMQPA
ncbi:MAG: hypothetical protein ACXVQ5_06160 [Actinomycetota bacterium]